MAGALKRFRDRLAAFDLAEEQRKVFAANTNAIEKLQTDQMYQGRGYDGEYIRPFYSEDPYFKTKEAARRYAGWKQRITPHPQRPLDVPNLYINGYFHSTIQAKVSGDRLVIGSSGAFGSRLERKYPNAFGLDPAMRNQFREDILVPVLQRVLKDKTGLMLRSL